MNAVLLNCIQTVQIMCSIKFVLGLLLLLGCTAELIESSSEPSPDSFYDDLDDLLKPQVDPQDDQEKSQNHGNLEDTLYDELDKFLLSSEESNNNQNHDNTNNSIRPQNTGKLEEKGTSSQEQTKATTNTNSCGFEMQCVESRMCKNTTRNTYGKHVIQFRGLYVKEQCSDHQICCHTSDKIEMPPEVETNAPMQDCGIRNVNGVDGQRGGHFEANFGEFPWMMAILRMEPTPVWNLPIYIGGGSLLAPNVVLTAAHKVMNFTASELVVRAGEWDRSFTEEPYKHQDLQVQQIILHKDFFYTSNNIALLVLSASFHARPHISPICLPSLLENIYYSRCIVTGWGKEATTKEYPQILKKIDLPILPRRECNNKIGLRLKNVNFELDQGSICAGGEQNLDACYGDGGAPLVCPFWNNPHRYFQAGIVTWGSGCGEQNVPGVYTNVQFFDTWITQQLNKLNIESKYYTVK